jgi:small subunit ribosomal protein S1
VPRRRLSTAASENPSRGGDHLSRRNEVAIAQFLDAHEVGDELTGTVESIVSFGAFIKVAEDVHGLLHVSEYREAPEVGSALRVRIAAVDLEACRMSLVPASR